MSKRYQKKSATKKRRDKSGRPPGQSVVGGQTTGVMGGMVNGFRRAVSSDSDKSESKGSNLLWSAVLVTVVLAVVAWNFGR
ncbi:MAG: hypothetical protein WBG86_23450 [Polyangiales bacterium]